MALGSCSVAELTDVFQGYLLQHLPVSSLARLRAASKALCALVDTGIVSGLDPASFKSGLAACRASSYHVLMISRQ